MTHQIRTIKDDEKITEPGFYQISLDRHHSQPCDGPSVTSGVLRKMILSTPADVWAFHQLNPDRWPDEDRPALWMGRAMAAYIEGGMDEVSKHFLILPEDKPNRPNEKQVKAYEEGRATDAGRKSVEFWAKIEADHRTPLTGAEITMIKNMGGVLADNPMAEAAMGGIPEVTMAVQDERTGLWLLARPDTVNFDGTLSDYKKINTQGSPFNPHLVDARITKHGYDMQMAFAADVFEILTMNRPDAVSITAQWDKPPHHVIVREICDEDLRMASFRNRQAIDQFAHCLADGYWPGPGDDIATYRRPEWQRDQILQEMQTAGKAL